MKTYLFRLIAAVSLLTTISCVKEIQPEDQTSEEPAVFTYSFSIVASKGTEVPKSKALTMVGDTLKAVWAEGKDNGAGISGGDDSTGANVHIYGGTVEAKAGAEAAGKGGNAFGSSDDADGILEFHVTNTNNNQTHYYKVSAGPSSSSLSPVNYQNQVSACWGNNYAKVEPCTTHNYSGNTCIWCGHTK